MTGPLGEKKKPPDPPAQPEKWWPVEGKPRLQQNAKGQWRTGKSRPPDADERARN